MVTTSFATLPDGFQFLSLFDQAFAQVLPFGTITVTTAGGTYTVGTNNADILINGSGANSVQLPDATIRNNQPQSIVDIAGNAATFHITILPFGTQKIIGQSSIAITGNYGGYTLWPIPTGGWYVK